MNDIRSMSYERLGAELKELGLPKFRTKQIFSWLHRRGAKSFDEMTDLSLPLREQLSRRYYISFPCVERKQISKEDGTIKYLWRLNDGNCIETVVMSYKHGNTVCISTQVGCRMGCRFCASTIGGKVRDLTPGEMAGEVLASELDSGKKISNIVLMGIGEPLDNFDNVIEFLNIINHPEGMNIGMRHISLSTSGLVDKIDKLAQYDLQLTLSVSLHAPDDETRSEMMPVNNRWNVDSLLDACRRYFEKTGRRISYEYAMVNGKNDSDYHAKLLGSKLKALGGGAHVNLIPLNEVTETGMNASSAAAIDRFKKTVEGYGITVTVRRRLGGDIDASCGQLRRKTLEDT